MAKILNRICRFCLVITVVASVLAGSGSAVRAGGSGSPGPVPAHSVMAASNWKPGMDITGWWMSEKLDGVRGCWTGSQMVSRSGKQILLPHWFTRDFPPFALDGELWIGRGKFSELIRIVRRKNAGVQWERVTYHIFDVPHAALEFEKRLALAKEWFKRRPAPHVRIIPQRECRGIAHLDSELKRIEARGGEGIMLRRPRSLYRKGRTRDILKVKTFHDAEAVVVGYRPGKGRCLNQMGALVVELPDGIRFAIGTGFTDAQRQNPPPVGSTITFKFKEIGKSGVPRFASFLRVREKI